MARVLILLSVVLFSVYVTEQADFLQTDYIDKINEEATTWKAGVNFDPNTSKEHIIRLLGSKKVQNPNKDNNKMYKSEDYEYDNLFGKIPRKFDSRKKWSNCKMIGRVRDQGNCGSGWAVATSSAFADRLCIATKGEFNQMLSVEEVLFCCNECGTGCNGGEPIKAWEYFNQHGIVTGGDYNSGEGCAPYKVPVCPYDGMSKNFTCSGHSMEPSHDCPRTCYGVQTLDFDDDHRYIKYVYYLTFGSIQQDVMTYGPIEASFDVYDDFINYKSGIYSRTENATYLGSHSVKLIGWGKEHGTLYWLMVNSWNTTWGDNGLFKIKRDSNECGVDYDNTGGLAYTAH